MKKKQDARKVSQKELAEKRWKIIELRGEGISNIETAKAVGMKPQTVSTLYNRCLREGEDIVDLKKRGRSKCEGRKLSKKTEEKILTLLIDTTPLNLGYGIPLWTQDSVQALIQKEENIKIPMSTTRDYLKRWGLTSGKSIKNPITTKLNITDDIFTLRQKLHKINLEVTKNNGEILWVDRIKTEEQNSTVFYAITKSKKRLFALYSRRSKNSEGLIDFFEKIIGSLNKKAYLIINEKSKIFFSKDVKAWLQNNRDELEVKIMEHL